MKKILLIGWITLTCFHFASAQYIPKDKRKKTETVKDSTQTNPNSSSDNQNPSNNTRERSSFAERLKFGGNIGIDFPAQGIFLVNLSPLVGYQFTEKLIAGLGGTYQYIGGNVNNSFGQQTRIRQNYYGGRIFATHSIVEPFSAWVELETIYGTFYNDQFLNTQRGTWITSPLVGAALNQTFGNRGLSGNIVVLYNLNYDDTNLYYASPWVIRTGFIF